MNFSRQTWSLFSLAALLSLIFWIVFSYPNLSFIDFSISRNKALTIAKDDLSRKKDVDISKFKVAAIFINNTGADRYLQKTLGFAKEKDFLQNHDFDLFLWVVRFFKENKKEEFQLAISAKSGEVVSFAHIIDDTQQRDFETEENSEKIALQFLQEKFHFGLADYTFHGKQAKKYDNRTDYAFTWQKNNVYIPWTKNGDDGGAKLLTSVTVSGKEILSFNKNQLDVPEKFSRMIERQQQTGGVLSAIFAIFYILLLAGATFVVATCRNHLIMNTTKKFFLIVVGILFLISIIDHLNEFNFLFFYYETTSSLPAYLWHYGLNTFIYVFFMAMAVIMPGLAGESLRYEVFPAKKHSSFLYYILSTFFTRQVFFAIVFGYLVAAILLGIQTLAFEIGHRFLGVWVEQKWVTQISSAYLPFLTALIIGLKASFSEEITFRVFAINWFKKISGKTIPAVILASILWGYGHSHYLVFPMWFRGIEVAVLGIFLSFVYLNYGIIPVLVGHYIFDVFWGTSGFLFGKANTFDFYSSLSILLLPCCLGLAAFFLNKPANENPLQPRLNKRQLYNLRILNSFLTKENMLNYRDINELRKELLASGWDIIVIEAALESSQKSQSG